MYTIYISNEISNQSSKEIPWKLQSLRSEQKLHSLKQLDRNVCPNFPKKREKKVSMMHTIAEHFTEKVE